MKYKYGCFLATLSLAVSSVSAQTTSVQRRFDFVSEGAAFPYVIDASGVIPGQAVSWVRKVGTDNLSGTINFVVHEEIINCALVVEGCTGGPGTAALTTETILDGTQGILMGVSGEDTVFMQSQVQGNGTITSSAPALAFAGTSIQAFDWQQVTFDYVGGGEAPSTIDVDMTYSVDIQATSASAFPPNSATSLVSLLVYDTSTYDVDETTGQVSIIAPFFLSALGVSLGGTTAEISLIDEMVTLALKPNTIHWISMGGGQTINARQLQNGDNDLTGLDASVSTFVDPVFALNPEWASANPGVADDIVINRIINADPVDVSIRPYSRGRNWVNVRSNGIIPVAVLSSDAFDALDIDPSTLQFGPKGASPARRPRVRQQDVDGDGDLDLLVFFKTKRTGIRCGDNEASVRGETFVGLPIMGSDSVRPFPCRRR